MPRHGRAALLRLAAWFEDADPRSADEIYTAAFAVHGATHLGGPCDEPAGATVSWWEAPLASVAAARLASALPADAVRDHAEQRARLRDAAESSVHWRRSAAQELHRVLAEATGGDSRIRLSNPAMEVLMELLTAALGSGDATRRAVSAGDLELGIRLHVRHDPEASITLRGSGGDLSLEGLRLRVTPFDAAGEPDEAAASREPSDTHHSPTPASGTALPFAREA
ncbi:DUF2397 family protein [Streptomonospora wellingtoniae]|uniref:DUF2397 family protein n=1 Tax=Streptomonospora wellingtoniae TaxID=3075544 RepID=A0ABU2KMK2_9ACTN|nr:DUF2397 family protein [Streptomonospora sp. DSM 45055]MDT0300495.1 DUF2397 family protein [Streptomonospora sp. DSM 45055]